MHVWGCRPRAAVMASDADLTGVSRKHKFLQKVMGRFGFSPWLHSHDLWLAFFFFVFVGPVLVPKWLFMEKGIRKLFKKSGSC